MSVTLFTAAQRIAALRDWCIRELPALNAAATNGQLRDHELIALLNHTALVDLPAPAELDQEQLIPLLMILGFLGCSVERHTQQQAVVRGIGRTESEVAAVTPGRGLAALRVNAQLPFRAYFAQIADRAQHPHRDSLYTLIEFNGPAVLVRDPADATAMTTTPVGFNDGRFLSFSGSETELNLYILFKLTIALQTAANSDLGTLLRPDVALDSSLALAAAIRATHYMLAMRAQFHAFLKRATFDIDIFFDVFRQYQCPWTAGQPIRPPSGANDPASLARDLMLFADLLGPSAHFPGFRKHVAAIGRVLLPAQQAYLKKALAHPSLEDRLMSTLGMQRAELAALSPQAGAALVRRKPWLAGYVLLYNAQRDLARAHHAIVTKYVIRPKRERDYQADPREAVTVVDNARGVTGMDPMGILIALNTARANHILAPLNHAAGARELLREALSVIDYCPLSQEQLLALARFAKPIVRPGLPDRVFMGFH